MDSLTLISGTKEDDVLSGTSGTDILLGGNGEDVLNGGAGNDLLSGGNGEDALYGGDGNDLLLAGNGNDLLDGGDGNDLLSGGNGSDSLDGGDGNDLLDGGNGNDSLDGGSGSDIILAGNGNDDANYTWSENTGSTDYYDGGKGFDTLQLTLTSAEFALAQEDIAAFNAFLHSGGYVFQFQSFDLTVRNFEALVFNIVAGNVAPEAQDDSYSLNEDSMLLVAAVDGVLAGDTDTDGDALSAILVAGPAHGTLTLDPGGSFTYTPALDYNGPDSFTYVANDGALDSDPATVSLTVNAVNDRPLADPDSYSTNEDTPLSIAATQGVLDGDTDADGDALSARVVSDPSNGTLSLNANGSFTYTPDADFNGTDSFTYVANDGALDSNPATVNLTINAVNDKPLAVPDAYSTNEDTPLSVTAAQGVLEGDMDADGDPLSAILVAGPVHGALALQSDGSFVYTPNLNYFGPDSFTYKAFDGALYSDEATVRLSVNVPPVARNDMIERTGHGGPIHVAVIADGSNSAEATKQQIEDSTVFNFSKLVDVLGTGSTPYGEAVALNFSKYDVVVIGENGGGSGYFDNPELFTALTAFVNAGHGVVSTGIFAYKIAGYSSNPALMLQADIISPTGDNGTSILMPGGIDITVDASHPITAGVSNFVTSDWYELADDIDPDNLGHILATGGSSAQAAIVYADNVGTLGSARTVFLGAMHMADPYFSSNWTREGAPDKILEQAIAWATGTATDEDTPLVIDSATLLANDAPGNGGPLNIASVSATSTLGALVSLDTGGNIVYDPTAALNYLNAGEIVQDSFDYRAIDSNGAETFATASLSVAGRAEPVTAGVTSFTSFEESLDYGLGQTGSPSTPDADTLL